MSNVESRRQANVSSQVLLAEVGRDTTLAHEVYFLTLLLRMGLIPTQDSSIYMVLANKIVCANLYFIGGALLYIPISTIVMAEDDHGDDSFINLLGRIIFCVYTPTMYIYISNLAGRSPGIITLLKELASREHESNSYCNPCHKQYPIKVIVFVVMFLNVMNVLVSIFSPSVASSVLGLSNNPVFLIYLHTVVYFLSFGWLLPIPFVYLGCKLLTDKVKYLIAYVHTEFKTIKLSDDKNNSVDLTFVMSWHDELYEKNRLLNKILSGMVTVTIFFLAVACTLLAVSLAIEGYNKNIIFWFIANIIILYATSFPAAELEIQNKIFGIELGALPMPARTLPDLNLYLNLYQTCAIKTTRSEFGIFVIGTKLRITFLALMRVGSITLSVILFLGGLRQSTN